jgi:type I restriction enzyme S subunit
MGVTKAEGMVPMRERTIGSDLGRYLVVRKNWFAYNPMRINIGSIARWGQERDVIVSPDYVVLRCKGEDEDGPSINPDYIDHLRRSNIWERFVTASGNGSVRVRIYYADLGRMRFLLPSPQEQRKIALVLNTLDQEISLLRRELEALKQQKKGLMQLLLTGKVRLPESARETTHA